LSGIAVAHGIAMPPPMSVAKEAAVLNNLAMARKAKRRKLGSSKKKKKKGEAANTSSEVKVEVTQRELQHLQQQAESFESVKKDAKANESALAEQIGVLKEERDKAKRKSWDTAYYYRLQANEFRI
jgi:hypothetical protein